MHVDGVLRFHPLERVFFHSPISIKLGMGVSRVEKNDTIGRSAGRLLRNLSEWAAVACWGATFLFASGSLGQRDLAVLLVTLALAEVAARGLVIAGGRGGDLRKGKDTRTIFLLSWCSGLVLLVPLAWTFPPLLFDLNPVSALTLPGLVLVRGLQLIGHPKSRRRTACIRAVWHAVPVLVILSLDLLDRLTADLVLLSTSLTGLLLLWPLAVSETVMPRQRPPTLDVRGIQTAAASTVAFFRAHFDLLVLPLLFAPPVALPYLAARAFTFPLVLLQDQLERAAKPVLAAIPAGSLRGAAARLNLGLMLTGFGAGLALLALLGYADRVGVLPFGLSALTVKWMILATMARAMFGAVYLLGELADRKRTNLLIDVLGCILFGVACAAVPPRDALSLVQMTTALNLGTAAVLAILLARRGLSLPGFTALFAGRIRLLGG